MKQIDTYKKQLLKAGFSEAKLMSYRFFRAATESTAFIVNLTENESGLAVLYGFCTTSHHPEYKDFFEKWGTDDSDCNFRYYLTIQSNEDESKAKELIEGLYILYANVEKDALLNVIKERRKIFLNKITAVLKPLGFRKKGNKWTNLFDDEYTLTVEAQKSAYSDQYYFMSALIKIQRSLKRVVIIREL